MWKIEKNKKFKLNPNLWKVQLSIPTCWLDFTNRIRKPFKKPGTTLVREIHWPYLIMGHNKLGPASSPESHYPTESTHETNLSTIWAALLSKQIYSANFNGPTALKLIDCTTLNRMFNLIYTNSEREYMLRHVINTSNQMPLSSKCIRCLRTTCSIEALETRQFRAIRQMARLFVK